MLINIIENLLSLAARGAKAALTGRARPAQPPAPAEEPVRAGDIVVGRQIMDDGRPGAMVTLAQETLTRHVYLLGSTGCGKSTLILRIIEALLGRRTCVILDLRGDFIARVLPRLAAIGGPEQWAGRLLVVDPTADHVVGFNPLSGSGDLYSRVFLVLDVLRRQSDWGVRIDEVMRNSLIALAQTGWSLLELEPLLNNGAFRAQIMASVQDSAVLAFFNTYERLSDENKLAWALPCLNKVTPLLATPALRQMFGQRESFRFADWIDREPGRVVLVSLAVDRFHHAAHLVGGLFVAAFQAAVMARAKVPEAERIPVTLFLDEFENVATDRFHEIIAEGRRFGLGLCLSHQNLTQLVGGLREALLNNVRSQFYFVTGASDAAELAGQIVSDLPAKDVKAALMAQGVGEATLLRRGQAPVRVRVENCPDPNDDPADIRAAALEMHGRPRGVVEAELLQREADLRRIAAPPPEPVLDRAPKPRSRDAKTTEDMDEEKPTYEIREAGKSTKRSPRKRQ